MYLHKPQSLLFSKKKVERVLRQKGGETRSPDMRTEGEVVGR